MFTLSLSIDDVNLSDFCATEPGPADFLRFFVMSLTRPASARAGAPRGRNVPACALLAARLVDRPDVVAALEPLCFLLDTAPMAERPTAAAASALMHGMNPWGWNAAPRCIRCRRNARELAHRAGGGSTGAKPLRTCASCRTARYCSQDCQRADWDAHKDVCRFIARYREARGR